MPDDQHPTRLRMLDAGLALADDKHLMNVSVDEIVRAAEVAKGTFYVHFDDRAQFLVALHARFHDALRDRMRVRVRDVPAGAERLRATAVAYLDGCLGQPGVKAMLHAAHSEPAIADAVQRSNERFARGAADDFRVLGRAHPLESARLFVASTADVARFELERGRRLERLRQALWETLGRRR